MSVVVADAISAPLVDRLSHPAIAVTPPVPPAVIGLASLASATRSSIVWLYFADSMSVSATAVVPAGFEYIPDPLRGMAVTPVL